MFNVSLSTVQSHTHTPSNFLCRSAPEQKDTFTIHVRSVGGWTNRLHQYFVEENDMIEKESRGILPEQKLSLRKR